MTAVGDGPLGASFRDPAGFVFEHEGEVYRQVNAVYREDYDHLVASGLLDRLVSDGLLIEHREVEDPPSTGVPAYRVLRPRRLPLVTYPYEWCFSQLRDAARLTLRVQKAAIGYGMSLKDASAYNAQRLDGRSVFIDTLSFERYDDSRPWAAYRQFCEHFLAPLALMARVDPRLGLLQRTHHDGVPLDLASRMLPAGSWLQPGLAMHVHLHARSQARHAGREISPARLAGGFTRRKLEALLESLEAAVDAISLPPRGSVWTEYYQEQHNYGEEGLSSKSVAVAGLLHEVRPSMVWDLGANTGRFSRLAAEAGATTVASLDSDPECVEILYREITPNAVAAIHPLVVDLRNPSPGLGWGCSERPSLFERGRADLVLALGLVHHLAIGNNTPLTMIADQLARLGRRLVVEWIPKQDSQVQRLLSTRRDIFGTYSREGFEAAFSRRFELEAVVPVSGTERALYLMRAG